MVITRVGPLSCAKIVGTLYAILGLVFGAIFSLVSMLSGVMSRTSEAPGLGVGVGFILGAGAIVVFPVLYGGMGFVMSLLGAWLYNLLAGLVGGIELELSGHGSGHGDTHL